MLIKNLSLSVDSHSDGQVNLKTASGQSISISEDLLTEIPATGTQLYLGLDTSQLVNDEEDRKKLLNEILDSD